MTGWPDRGRRAVSWALELALRELDGPPVDQAAVALARRYAADIDEAALVHEQVRRALVELDAVHPDLAEKLQVLAIRIEETHVLALLGPKLEQVLTDLCMTPRARFASSGKKGGGSGGPPTGNPLAVVRGEYGRRAAGVDAS